MKRKQLRKRRRMNHVFRACGAARYVNDVESMKAFYESYVNATANEKYHNPKTGLATYFLLFETGA